MGLRITLLATLALGLSLATGQVAYGASALSDTTSATAAQYSPTPAEGERLPEEVTGENDGSGTIGDSDGSDVIGDSASGQIPATAGGGSELPFTGYAAMSLILLGLAVLCGGLVLRRTQRSSRT